MDERFLHHIWDGGHLQPDLKTVSGKSLRIGYSGQYNTNRGPDFTNCGFVLDGVALRGDIEIHQQTTDWHAHNHTEDPYYNRVSLHVVYKHNGKHNLTIKENGEAIEILELQHQLSEDIEKLLREHQPRLPKSLPGYCDLLSAMDKDRLVLTLKDYGLKRFMGKVNRYNAALMFSGFDQILYEGLFEAMGYDKNKTAMLTLAQQVPLETLISWLSDSVDILDILSVYLVASKLLDKSQKLMPPGLIKLLTQRWEVQNRFARLLDIDWQLFRVRPASHPVYRLMALVPMICRQARDGLMQSLLTELDPRLSQPQLEKAFDALMKATVLPGAEGFPRPGKGTLSTAYVNVCLPMFFLWGQKTGDWELTTRVKDAYAAYGGLAENSLTRIMISHTDTAHQKLINSRAVYQQALIELYQRYCRYHVCDECRAQQIG